MVSPKVSPEVKSLLDWEIGKVLVSKRNNLFLRDEKRQLVFAFFGQLGQLNTRNLCTGVCRQFIDFGVLEQVREGSISIFSVVVMRKGLKRRAL